MKRLTFVMLLAAGAGVVMLLAQAPTAAMPTPQQEAEIGELRQHLEQLERKAHEQKERGNQRAVDEIREKIEEVAGTIHEMERDAEEEYGNEGHLRKLHPHIEELERQVREQVERGNLRVVDRLREKMEEVVDTIRAIGHGDDDGHRRQAIRKMHDHLEQLARKAREHEERGDERGVAEIREEMANVEREVHRMDRDPHDGHDHGAHLRELRQHLEELEHAVRQQEERGNERAVDELREEMERVIGAIREIEEHGHEGDGHEDPHEARLRELHGRLGELEREVHERQERGDERAVDELREEMERTIDAIREIEEHGREGDGHEDPHEARLRELHGRLGELEREVHERQERGDERAVDELREEMERTIDAIREIERRGDEEQDEDENEWGDDDDHPSSEDVLMEIRDLIRDLRAEVGGLREEVHMIRERLDGLQVD